MYDLKKIGEEKKNDTGYGEYMVYVEGRSMPKKIHTELDIVLKEADRLTLQPENVGRVVYVMEICRKTSGKVFIEDL